MTETLRVERSECPWLASDLEVSDFEPRTASFFDYEPGTAEFRAKSASFDQRLCFYRAVKRLFDVVVSGMVIFFGFIPAIILSILIRIDTGGSAIYTQTRVGRYGVPFKIHKFRTMVADSDDVEKYFTPEQLEAWHKEKKVDDDPRITRLGRILRATSLDEFANFIDVFIGRLSIIGPRAISYGELYWFDSDQAELLSVRPGITGLWQAGPRNDADFESGQRQALELKYVRTASLGLDGRLFIDTFGAVFSRTGK